MKKILGLHKVSISKRYQKQWNVSCEDFIKLFIGQDKVSDTLYRTGFMGGRMVDGYFIMLKYVEDHYDDSITTDKAKKPHLASHWCILNDKGEEKIVLGRYRSPSLLGGVVYLSDGEYRNIETNELISKTGKSTHLESEEYIFVEDRYNSDESKRGVCRIKKSDGSVTLYP